VTGLLNCRIWLYGLRKPQLYFYLTLRLSIFTTYAKLESSRDVRTRCGCKTQRVVWWHWADETTTNQALEIRRSAGRERMDTLSMWSINACHRRQCSFYFPVLPVVYELRASTRIRVHVPLDVTLAQTSSIARQLAATGASRGSSRSSSKAGSLAAQHPAVTSTHFRTSLAVTCAIELSRLPHSSVCPSTD